MKANMNLEAGMLAMIIGSKYNPPNIGKIVTLVRFLEKDEYCKELGASAAVEMWVVEGCDLACTLQCQTTGIIINDVWDIGGVEAQFLMPIIPEEDPLEVERKLEMKV